MVFQLKCRDAVRRRFAVSAAVAVVGFAPLAAHGQSAIQTWNQALLTITQQTSGMLVAGPPDVAMQMAIMDNAMYDAVNATSGSKYKPFAYGTAAPTGASAQAAALTAGYQALTGIFSQPVWASSTYNNQSAKINSVVLPEITATYTSAMASLGSSQAVTDGVAVGTAAANASLALLNGSGAGSAQAAMIDGLTAQTPTGAGTTPGVYVPPSASGGRPEMYPLWGTVTPVGASAAAILTLANSVTLPGVTTATTPATQVQQSISSAAYANALLETECTGSGAVLTGANAQACANAGFSPETLAQARAALFWNDPGTTIQPPGHWLQIADTVMASAGLDLMQQARLSASMSTAIVDAGIAAWGDKYEYNLWRPITAIRNCTAATGAYSWNTTLTADNATPGTANSCDKTWVSLIATPPHPDYVAGHPAFSGAAATVLAAFFGSDSFTYSSLSNSYCNGGTPGFDTDGFTIISCTLNAAQATASVVYSATTYTTCNSMSLSSGASNVNDSPLICAITENFSSFSAASSGPNGSEYSRVSGGIHTPFAVADALNIGNAIGALDFANNFYLVPEPSALMLLATAGGGMFGVARRRRR